MVGSADMKKDAGLLLLMLAVGWAIPGFSATNGLVNFGQVNDSLYRGAQPDALAMKQLKDLGVKSIINLRMTNELWNAESALATTFSMAYTNIPLDNLAAPTDAQVANVLAAIENMPKPVFMHCQFGCDRTGTLIACYRIRHDHWPNSKALNEAKVYGFSPFELGMRQYIMRFKQ